MKLLKKTIGFIIVVAFILLVIGSFIYNIINAGWYFILSMVIIASIVLLLAWGISLLSDNDKVE